MTARRAVKELTDEGLFTRTPGLGTFVSAPSAAPPTLEIVDVVAEAQRNGSHSHRILALDSVFANESTATIMGLASGATIFQLTLIHFDNNRPIQWQSISVNPKLVPALMKQKLDKLAPDAYLNWIAPATSIQYQVKAVIPRASQIRELGLSEETNPICLQLTRESSVRSEIISVSKMLHPADTHILGANLETHQ
jgi:GntR family histidine utilization transcriptional repressor